MTRDDKGLRWLWLYEQLFKDSSIIENIAVKALSIPWPTLLAPGMTNKKVEM